MIPTKIQFTFLSFIKVIIKQIQFLAYNVIGHYVTGIITYDKINGTFQAEVLPTLCST